MWRQAVTNLCQREIGQGCINCVCDGVCALASDATHCKYKVIILALLNGIQEVGGSIPPGSTKSKG